MSDEIAAPPVYDCHVWLACRCGGNYTTVLPPKIGDPWWCHFHRWESTVQRFTAIKREATFDAG